MLMGGNCTVYVEGGIWKLSELSAQYCCEPKIVLKNSLFKSGGESHMRYVVLILNSENVILINVQQQIPERGLILRARDKV